MSEREGKRERVVSAAQHVGLLKCPNQTMVTPYMVHGCKVPSDIGLLLMGTSYDRLEAGRKIDGKNWFLRDQKPS